MIYEIPGYTRYAIDKKANVWSFQPNTCSKKLPTRPHKLRVTINGDGYRSVHPVEGANRRSRTIASLMLMTFVGPRPRHHVVCHGPKGKLVDTLDNLYWGTPKRNAQDRLRDGTQRYGESSGSAKLTAKQVVTIRKRYIPRSRQHGCRAIARELGMHHDTIQKIMRRILWRNV